MKKKRLPILSSLLSILLLLAMIVTLTAAGMTYAQETTEADVTLETPEAQTVATDLSSDWPPVDDAQSDGDSDSSEAARPDGDSGGVAADVQMGETADYSDPANWLNLPEITYKVDTIYICPTTYDDPSEEASEICDIDNEEMRQEAQEAFEAQATVYEDSTNIFAPFYRQVNMAVAFRVPPESLDEMLEGASKEDIYAALDYYFENLNEGRPFVLAGHSQGSHMLTYVLSEYMTQHEDYYERMVAAYLLGYSVTKEYLEENPHLKFADNAYETGVIISWNTEGPGNGGQDNFAVRPGAVAINPLNWKRDDTFADKDKSLGARIKNEETGKYEAIPKAADAQIDPERGVIITHTDAMRPMPGTMGYGPESYHSGDYTLWYYNIKQNVEKRIAYYLTDHSDGATDYSDPENWFLIPEITKEVDTFFIYPTVFMDISWSSPDYAAVGDPSMITGVEDVYAQQACVFEGSTNLFMPYYRQANIKIEIAASEATGDITPSLKNHPPQEDIWAALDYYFENYNEGRPFIIAGHSQGAALTRLVLKEYFAEHPDYYERMIAAYVLGYSITQDDLDQNPHLKFAEGADDTGVIVSWNTEGPGNKNEDNLVVLEGAISINPLNWKRDDTYASSEENLGSRMYDEETKEYEIKDIHADAQIDPVRGVVICTTTEAPFIDMSDKEDVLEVFGPESFHNGDYPFYFYNIRENIRTRIEAWQ